MLSITSLSVMAVFVAWTALIAATLEGVATMIAVVPIYGFLGTSWIWAALSATALVLAARAPRRRLPVGLAVAGIIVAVGGAIVILTVPF